MKWNTCNSATADFSHRLSVCVCVCGFEPGPLMKLNNSFVEARELNPLRRFQLNGQTIDKRNRPGALLWNKYGINVADSGFWSASEHFRARWLRNVCFGIVWSCKSALEAASVGLRTNNNVALTCSFRWNLPVFRIGPHNRSIFRTHNSYTLNNKNNTKKQWLIDRNLFRICRCVVAIRTQCLAMLRENEATKSICHLTFIDLMSSHWLDVTIIHAIQ